MKTILLFICGNLVLACLPACWAQQSPVSALWVTELPAGTRMTRTEIQAYALSHHSTRIPIIDSLPATLQVTCARLLDISQRAPQAPLPLFVSSPPLQKAAGNAGVSEMPGRLEYPPFIRDKIHASKYPSVR
ncbi:MAG: hypothetical protein KF690_02155 [Bacteroidetes bacterium]|nr:hypothetical protein [Bacteroidota bacterium]